MPLVELVIDRYHEVRPFLRRQTVPEATAAGTRESRAALARRLPASGRAVTRRTIVQTEPGWVIVTSSAETIQEIALPAQRGTEKGFDRGSTAPAHRGE